MKRVLALIVVMMLAVVAVGAFAGRADRTLRRTVAPMRSVTSAVGMQQVYDTIAVFPGERVLLTGVTLFGDDSALTPTVRVRFMSSISRTQYLQLSDTWAANQVKATSWAPNYVFPTDTSVVIHTYIVGGAISTLDTMAISASYQIERP